MPTAETNDLRERVAMAMHAAHYDGACRWDHEAEFVRDRFRRDADAAIATVAAVIATRGLVAAGITP